ncbi:MAG: PEGA domain-containing protein [Myxococcota bacterium]
MFKFCKILPMVIALLTATPGFAQTPNIADAQERVNAAAKLFGGGDYEGALRELRAAEAIAAEVDPDALPSIRFNMARCLEELGRTQEAIDAYEAYNKLPDVSHRKQRAFQALNKLRKQVFGSLSVACDPTGSVIEIKGVTEGAPSCPWRSDAVPPGSYALKVTHPGYLEEIRLVEVASGKAQSVQIALNRDPEAAPLTVAGAPTKEPFRLRAGPTIVTGLGVAALAAGVGFNVSAANNSDAAEDPLNFLQRNELADAFERDRTLAIASYAVGGAALVTGIVWFIAGGKKKNQTSHRVVPTVNGLAVQF